MNVNKNKKSLNIVRNLKNPLDIVVEAIHRLTGKNHSIIKHGSYDKLQSYLSFLLSESHLSQIKLYRNFNQNIDHSLFTVVSLSEERHTPIQNKSKKNKNFGFKKDLYEWIKLLFAKKGDFNMKRAMTNSSVYITNVDCSHAYINKHSIKDQFNEKNFTISNSNNTCAKITR